MRAVVLSWYYQSSKILRLMEDRAPCAGTVLSMNLANKTLRKVKATLSRYEMIQPGDLIVVGVSGGPDSVCLLHILHRLKNELKVALLVAHFDHGLRPGEDAPETRFVASLAESMGLPFETEKARSLLRQSIGSQEEAARNARYRFLEKMRKRHGAREIALAHHLNDQAETILMRLLRGSGPSGLGGIPPCRDRVIIRPLIEINRKEVEAYVKAQGLSYVTDSSNLQTLFLRNRIRIELLPLLENYQPRLVERLAETAEILREEDKYLEQVVKAWIDGEAETSSGGAVSVSVRSFLDLPPPLKRRVVRQLIERVKKTLRRVGSDHVRSVLTIAEGEKPQAMLDLPGKLCVQRTYERLVFKSASPGKDPDFSYVIPKPGVFPLKKIGRTLALGEMTVPEPSFSKRARWTAHVDAEKIRFPLRVRNFRPGDRFVPLGMKGHKKVKDFFVDQKVPAAERHATPIVFSEDMPVWVCGYRLDDRFKVTPKTKRVLKMTLRH
jgi:tRNA(Ile)-lysidine synthase